MTRPRRLIPNPTHLIPNPTLPINHTARCNYKDALGITRTLGEICEKQKVSIFSMLQAKGVDSFVVLVENCKSSAITKVAKELSKKDW